MVINSYSKINLSLNINSKLKNGLHEIQSYFCLINLKDKINIRKIKKQKDTIFFKGPFAKSVKHSDNSISNILNLLRKLKLISNYYHVTVSKNIPVFGGLGGGTSNAVFLLRFLLKNKINKIIINKMEKLIGSDFRIFFYKQGFIKKLKTIINIRRKYKLYFLLVRPNIKCSTKEIYSKVRKYSQKIQINPYKINRKSNFIKYLLNSKNELQPIVEKKYPRIKKLLQDIGSESGCYFSRMSGSGSVCYGLFNNERTAKKALIKIKTKYPKFWFSIAKTI